MKNAKNSHSCTHFWRLENEKNYNSQFLAESQSIKMSSAEVNLIANEAEWARKEEEYQKQILNLKKLNEKLIVYNDDKSKKHESDMQKLQNDMQLVQQRLAKFELDELKGLEGNTSNNMKAFKEKYEGVLRKAQDLLFERQKTIKSLELKMEAMNIQVRY